MYLLKVSEMIFTIFALFFGLFAFITIASGVLKTSLTKKEYHKLIESEKNESINQFQTNEDIQTN